MRYSPLVCPDCGKLAVGILEHVPATVLFDYPSDVDDTSDPNDIQRLIDDGAELEHAGESKMHWDSSRPIRTEDNRVVLVCYEGHEWPARDLDDSEQTDEPAVLQEVKIPAQFRGIDLGK